MFIQLTLFASVLLCYGGSYAANRRQSLTGEIGKCGERQDFSVCSNDVSIFLSPPLFSYNPATNKCEFVFKQCSRTRANKFRTKSKCKRFCTGRKKGCYRKGKWFDHREQMDSLGCCQCVNGLMACEACFGGYPSINGPTFEQELSICSNTCEFGHNEDCTCKVDCREACGSCFNGGSECPGECDCEEEVFNLAQQIIH